MRRFSIHALGALAVSLLTLGGCENQRERQPVRRVESALAVQRLPWDTIPPESIYGAGPVENLRVVPVELDLLGIPQSWEGMRIAVLSDLQLGLWEQNDEVAAAAVRRAVSLRPDLVVLLGDYLATGRDTATLRRVLAPLRGRRALAVLGDRDVRDDSLAAAVTLVLRSQGVQVLRNGSVPLVFQDDTAFVSGVDPELAGKPAGDQEWILGQMGGATRKALLLTHIPQLAARAPDGRYPGILAGNTFCGRVEVPGTPRLSWLSGTALPGAAVPGVPRIFRLDTSVMYVTCGLGYGFVPIRFGAAPEVALVTLRAVQGRPAATLPDSISMDTLIQRYQRRDSAAAADTTG